MGGPGHGVLPLAHIERVGMSHKLSSESTGFASGPSSCSSFPPREDLWPSPWCWQVHACRATAVGSFCMTRVGSFWGADSLPCRRREFSPQLLLLFQKSARKGSPIRGFGRPGFVPRLSSWMILFKARYLAMPHLWNSMAQTSQGKGCESSSTWDLVGFLWLW